MQRNFGYIGEKQDKSGVYTTGVLGGIFHLDTTKFTSPRFLGQDLASSYYQIASNRTIQTGSSGDSANNWDVAEVQCGNTGSYRLYLVAKQTTSTTYYNDICVAAVQHLSSSNTTKNIWVFTSSSSGNGRGWARYYARENGTSSLGPPSVFALNNVASLSYQSMGVSNLAGWGWNTGTGSSYTGMADGISESTNNLIVGNYTMPQASGRYYLFAEVSGANRYSSVVMRSGIISVVGGDYFRVCYNVTIPSSESSNLNLNDTLWMGLA